MTRTYSCYRVNGYPRVDVLEGNRNRPLLPGPSFKVARLDNEFDWGTGGSAPDQLALAILMDLYDDKALALKNYDSIKWTLLAIAPRAGVNIEESQVRALVKR